jgi:hypothetical protein
MVNKTYYIIIINELTNSHYVSVKTQYWSPDGWVYNSEEPSSSCL